MLQLDNLIGTVVANQGGAMEADTISKNGRSLKSRMSKRSIFIIACFTVILPSYSVSMKFAESSLAPFQHYGYIIDESGQKIDGLIELNAWGKIWMNQSKIGFCPQSEIDKAKAAGKTKIKSKWYKATQLQGYGFGDKKFVTKKVKLSTGTAIRMVEVLSEQQKTYKFYNSGNEPSDPNKYVVLRETPTGELD